VDPTALGGGALGLALIALASRVTRVVGEVLRSRQQTQLDQQFIAAVQASKPTPDQWIPLIERLTTYRAGRPPCPPTDGTPQLPERLEPALAPAPAAAAAAPPAPPVGAPGAGCEPVPRQRQDRARPPIDDLPMEPGVRVLDVRGGTTDRRGIDDLWPAPPIPDFEQLFDPPPPPPPPPLPPSPVPPARHRHDRT